LVCLDVKKKKKNLSAFNILQSQLHNLAEKLCENTTFLSSVSCCLREQVRSVTQGNDTVEAIAVELTKLSALLLSFIALVSVVFLAHLISVLRNVCENGDLM